MDSFATESAVERSFSTGGQFLSTDVIQLWPVALQTELNIVFAYLLPPCRAGDIAGTWIAMAVWDAPPVSFT